VIDSLVNDPLAVGDAAAAAARARLHHASEF
jgi:hypothetical protein